MAFMDLGTAVRSYIEKRSFLSRTLSDTDYVDGMCREETLYLSYSIRFVRGIHDIQNYRHLLYP